MKKKHAEIKAQHFRVFDHLSGKLCMRHATRSQLQDTEKQMIQFERIRTRENI